MRSRTPLVLASSFALLASLAGLLAACSKQGEAERCDTEEDCESGLLCVERQAIQSRICCPPGNNQGSTPECRNELPIPRSDAGIDASDTQAALDVVVPVEGGLGTTCKYSSDCASGFRCRGNSCAYECNRDVDCQIESVDKKFCDTCGDHQCHVAPDPTFHGTDGVCGGDAAVSETDGDTADGESPDVTPTDTLDAVSPDDTLDGG